VTSRQGSPFPTLLRWQSGRRIGGAMRGDVWASIGFAGIVVFGWIVEATVKWAIDRAWSHLH